MASGSIPAAEGTSEEADLHNHAPQQTTDTVGGRYPSSTGGGGGGTSSQQQLAGIPTSITQASSSSLAAAAAVAAAATAGSGGVGVGGMSTVPHHHTSVVPGLMRVYESMTQTGPSSPTNTAHNTATTDTYGQPQPPPHHGMYQEQQQPESGGTGNSYFSYQSNPWPSYGGNSNATSSITIPPPYQLPLLQSPSAPQPPSAPLPGGSSNNNNSTSAGGPTPRHGRGGSKHEAASHASSSSTGRPMRNKRTIAAVAAAAAAAAAADDINGGYNSSSTGGSTSARGATKSRRKGSGGSNSSTKGGGGGGGGGMGDGRRDSVNNATNSNNNLIPNPSKDGSNLAAGSDRNKAGSKDDKNDGRWSKRFTWPDDLHRDFVSAIFDVGLKHSSPSSVMEQMPPHEQITTERIKSHLQKYRLHRQKSKKEFMTSYETTIAEMNKDGIDGVTALAGGQVAAHLTYASLNHPDPEPEESDDGGAANADDTEAALALVGSPNREIIAAQKTLSQVPPQEDTTAQHEDVFVLPRLTEAEKQSPIGTSLGYLMGLFFSLKQQLEFQRQEQQEAMAAAAQKQEQMQLQHPLLDHNAASTSTQDPRSAAAVFDSFASELGVGASKGMGSSSSAISGTAIIPMSVPSTTRNLEENSMMKREMQNQMAFQNKMRALKQQELIKYNKSAASASASDQHMLPPKKVTINTANMGSSAASSSSGPPNSTPFDATGVQAAVELQHKLQQDFQMAGESETGDGTGGGNAGVAGAGAASGRERSSSVAAMEGEDDFWNTAVVDDELFDFLMSN